MSETQIYDIYELTDISFFPLAIGYWIILGVLIAISILGYIYVKYRNKKLMSWKWQVKQELDYLLKNNQVNIVDIHNVIKKTLIHLYKRDDIANLSGVELLEYLNRLDKNGVDWIASGGVLANTFAPEKNIANSENIKKLLNEIKLWL